MALEYRYSCTIYGHNADARSVRSSPLNSSSIISASRDKTARVWAEDSDGKGYHQDQCFEGHTNFVFCASAVAPSEDYPDGLVFTGSSDKIIRIFSPASSDAISELKGHKDTVCALDAGQFSMLSSGSWDKTACVWIYKKSNGIVEGKKVMTLEGHAAAVWAVLQLQQGIMATGSADKTIKLWKAGKCVKTFTGHEDCVRDLARISACQFLSCANDATVRRWTTTGECLQVYYGHTSFIYSIAVLPDQTGFVTSGEDRTVRVWNIESRDTQQTIALPAQSAWSVTVIKNGDLVVALSDSTMRVFTRSEERVASDAEVAAYEIEVSESMIKKSGDESSEIDEKNVKDISALQMSGAKDEQVIMVRNGDKIEAHQWSEKDKQWTKLGDVLSTKNDKKTHNGREYDFVFDVDIQEGSPTLKLPYNLDEDPWFAAQRFIDDNDLSQYFLDEICNFILDNTKEARAKSGQQMKSASAQDPFTGGGRYVPGGSSDSGSTGGYDPFTGAGRYVPGESSASNSGATANGADPFTGGGRYVPGGGDSEVKLDGGAAADPMINPSRYIPGDDEKMEVSEPPKPIVSSFEPTSPTTEYYPKRGYITFETGKVDAIIGKVKNFSESCGPLTDADVESLKSLTVPSSSTDAASIDVLWKILSWPKECIFPALDILRLTCLKQPEAAKFLCSGTSEDDDRPAKLLEILCEHVSAHGNSKQLSANRLLSIRTLCNLFESPEGAAFMTAGYKDVFQALSAGFCAGLNEGSSTQSVGPFYGNKNVQIAAASLLLNYSVMAYSAGSSNVSFSPVVSKLSNAVRSSCVEIAIVHLVTGENLSDVEATFRYLVCLGTLISDDNNDTWVKEARALGAEKVVETAGAMYSSVPKIFECTKSLSAILFV